MILVSFKDYDLIPRYDGIPWTILKIYESAFDVGPWILIDTQDIPVPATDPANPDPLSFSTVNGTAIEQWYRIDFVDSLGNVQATNPVYNAAPIEIMASIDDINANLDGVIIQADGNNSELVQISVARVIRGYLSRTVDQVTLMSWQTPETTPDIIREIAGKLIASQVYFNLAAAQSLLIENNSFAQRKYDEAMALLNGIIEGTIEVPGAIAGGGGGGALSLTELDYFPVDATDRAFTLGMNL